MRKLWAALEKSALFWTVVLLLGSIALLDHVCLDFMPGIRCQSGWLAGKKYYFCCPRNALTGAMNPRSNCKTCGHIGCRQMGKIGAAM